MHSNKKQLAGSQFHGANLELLNPQAGKPKALGVSGVSDFKGFSADYSQEGSNPLHLGAGVSVMALKPSTSSFLKVEDYSIYKKKGVNALKGGNLYSGASNPKSLKTFQSKQIR